MSDKKILPPALAPFVMQWGELGSACGIGRSAARIHGLLLVSDRSLTADEIVAALDIARSNVSMSMKDLRAIGLVETQPSIGDRKERFFAVDDPIDIATRVAAWRKAREFDPAVAALKAVSSVNAPKEVSARLQKLSKFADNANKWHGQMAALSPGQIKAVMKAGAAVADLAPSKKKKKK